MYIDQNTWIRTYHVGKPKHPKGVFCPQGSFLNSQNNGSWMYFFFFSCERMAVGLKGKIHGFIQILFDGYHTTRYNDFTFYNYFKTIRSIFVLLKKWLYAKMHAAQCFQDLLRLFHLLNFWPYCICATAIV